MKTLLIAEIAQAHEGSLGNALAYIDAVADAGANAVKFQCHDCDPNDEMPAGYDLPQDSTRRDYWQRTGFVGYQWTILSNHARERGLQFGVTPFSIEALELVADRCDFIKIARQFYCCELHRAACTHNTTVIATGGGMNSMGLGLNEYNPSLHLGISDHSATIWPSLAAVAKGATICEVHCCWDRRQFGPDSKFSITIDELAQLAEGIRSIESSSNP